MWNKALEKIRYEVAFAAFCGRGESISHACPERRVLRKLDLVAGDEELKRDPEYEPGTKYRSYEGTLNYRDFSAFCSSTFGLEAEDTDLVTPTRSGKWKPLRAVSFQADHNCGSSAGATVWPILPRIHVNDLDEGAWYTLKKAIVRKYTIIYDAPPPDPEPVKDNFSQLLFDWGLY